MGPVFVPPVGTCQLTLLPLILLPIGHNLIFLLHKLLQEWEYMML